MTGHCTCGARLVEDAWFCHKCGKPQRDVGPAEAEEAPRPAEIPVPVVTVPAFDQISFRNRIAVRIAVLSAGSAWMLAQICSMVILSGLWIVMWFVFAGFIAVYVYHRRTGVFLSTGSGARMGWLTGTFCFLITLVIIVLFVAWMSSDAQLREQVRQQVASQNVPNTEEAFRIFESPAELAPNLFFGLILVYALSVGLPVLGGMLGAKVLEKE